MTNERKEENKRILLVEDQDPFAATGEEYLTSRGHRIDRARDYVEALRELDRNQYDCVITDYLFPEHTGSGRICLGRETAREIISLAYRPTNWEYVEKMLEIGEIESLGQNEALVKRDPNLVYASFLKAMRESEVNQPLGFRIAEKAKERNIFAVIATSGWHHGVLTSPLRDLEELKSGHVIVTCDPRSAKGGELYEENMKDLRSEFEKLPTERKDKEYTLIIEMFGKGNIILVSEGKIISCLESQSFSARKIAIHETYSYPPSRANIINLTFKDFKDLVNSSDKESIVKILAIDFSFGGIYSEEILSPLSIKKDKKILNDSELKGLYERIQSILKKSLSPVLINNDPFPFSLTSLFGEKVDYDSFSLALDSFTSTKAKTSFDKKLKQVIELKEIQINKIKELEQESIQFKEIGDLIYNNYSLIDNLIKQIKESKWKYNDEIIKEKNAKESKVVIEI